MHLYIQISSFSPHNLRLKRPSFFFFILTHCKVPPLTQLFFFFFLSSASLPILPILEWLAALLILDMLSDECCRRIRKSRMTDKLLLVSEKREPDAQFPNGSVEKSIVSLCVKQSQNINETSNNNELSIQVQLLWLMTASTTKLKKWIAILWLTAGQWMHNFGLRKVLNLA